ncbi:MAG: hypothetical protein R2793_10425 [Flavobacteriaceae bacterium]
MKKIKMIWDFRGPNAAHIANHHAEHLDEFLTQKGIIDAFTGTETHSDYYSIAFMVVTENWALDLRETLKPHRGQYYSQD